MNAILKTFGLANGYVRVTRTAGTAPWVAYGVVNDGAIPGARDRRRQLHRDDAAA